MRTEDAFPGAQSRNCQGSIGCERIDNKVHPPSPQPLHSGGILSFATFPPIAGTESFFALNFLIAACIQLHLTWTGDYQCDDTPVQGLLLEMRKSWIWLISVLYNNSYFLYLVDSHLSRCPRRQEENPFKRGIPANVAAPLQFPHFHHSHHLWWSLFFCPVLEQLVVFLRQRPVCFYADYPSTTPICWNTLSHSLPVGDLRQTWC